MRKLGHDCMFDFISYYISEKYTVNKSITHEDMRPTISECLFQCKI